MGTFSNQVVVTCEHASNRLPRGYALDPALRELHIAWDPGALPIARHLARHYDAELIAGRYSRLLVDLNRTATNRMLIRRVSDGHRIDFNYGLGDQERAERIERYYRPYRDAVVAAARQIIQQHGRCVHICVHTFTPALAGNVRGNDIGLLHDPSRRAEVTACTDLRSYLDTNTDYVTWFNRPYSGTADGILPAMRQRFGVRQFVGIELEINQKYAGDTAALRNISRAIAAGLDGSQVLNRNSAT